MVRAALLLLSLSLAAVAGCRALAVAVKPPLAVPRVEADVRHYRGTPVSGPTPPADPGTPEGALQAVATLVGLDGPPDAGVEAGLQPIGPQVRLLLTDKGAAPLQPAAELLSGAQAGPVAAADALAAIDGGGWGRAARIGELRAVLPPGVTASFELRRGDERFIVALRRAPREGGGGEGVELAIEVQRREAGPGDFAGGTPPGRPSGTRRELAVLEARPLSGHNDVAVVVPSPFAGEEARAIAAVIAISPAPPPQGLGAAAHRAAFATCRADLARDAAELGRSDAPVGWAAAPAPPDTALARAALLDPARRRGALFSLAQGTGAQLAEDLSIAGTEPLVATVTAVVAAELSGAFAPADGPILGWLVERGAVRALAADAGKPEVIDPAELFLLRRLGGVARVEDTLRMILARTRDLPDFERRLVEANRDLLDDADPGMRARALEWLEARRLAPKDYDPLGTLEARRAALAKAAGGGKK